jgi:hypothetical protein
MNAKGLYVSSAASENHEEFQWAAGNTIQETTDKFSTNNKISGGMPGVFSASVSVNYSSEVNHKRTTGYVRADAAIRKREEYIKDPSATNLKKYVTDNFKRDLKTKNAAQILNDYGTHIIARCYFGGVTHLYFSTATALYTSASRLEIVAKASAFGYGSVSSNNVSEQERKDFEENSLLTLTTDGGDLKAMSVAEFQQKYPGWVNSVKSGQPGQAVLCGIPEFSSTTMIPVWKIAEQVENDIAAEDAAVNPKLVSKNPHAKSQAMLAEFNKRLAAQQKWLNSLQ